MQRVQRRGLPEAIERDLARGRQQHLRLCAVQPERLRQVVPREQAVAVAIERVEGREQRRVRERAALREHRGAEEGVVVDL